MSCSDIYAFSDVISSINVSNVYNQQRRSSIIELSWELINTWLARAEPAVISAASDASVVLLAYSPPKQRETIVAGWAEVVRNRSRSGPGTGHFRALTRAYTVMCLTKPRGDAAAALCGPLLDRWAHERDVEGRVAILQSLVGTEVLRQNVDQLIGLVSEGLNDYTTNARGDVGSHVRLQAIRATRYLWESAEWQDLEASGFTRTVSRLFLPILRLAAEKLDRVRVEAQATLSLALQSESDIPLSMRQPLRLTNL